MGRDRDRDGNVRHNDYKVPHNILLLNCIKSLLVDIYLDYK